MHGVKALCDVLLLVVGHVEGDSPSEEFTTGEPEAAREALSSPKDVVGNGDRRFHKVSIT